MSIRQLLPLWPTPLVTSMRVCGLVTRVAVLAGMAAANGMRGDTYSPTFYPNAPSLGVHERGSPFRTEADARAWVGAKRREHEQAREFVDAAPGEEGRGDRSDRRCGPGRRHMPGGYRETEAACRVSRTVEASWPGRFTSA